MLEDNLIKNECLLNQSQEGEEDKELKADVLRSFIPDSEHH